MNYRILYGNKDKTYYSNSRAEILPFIPQNISQVLDVGCGNGRFGQILKDNFNCTVWGIEPDENSASEAQKSLDYVLNDSFNENIYLHEQKFDCIFFNDVLEHLVDPYAALKLSKNLLLPGGYVISSIPNILHFFTIYRILETQDWKYEETGILDKTHLRFFTKKSITRMFEECGFKVLRIQGINPTYGKKYNIFNLLFINKLKDMRYIQFITVSQI